LDWEREKAQRRRSAKSLSKEEQSVGEIVSQAEGLLILGEKLPKKREEIIERAQSR